MKIISKNFPCENIQTLRENYSSVDVLKEFLNENLENWLKNLEAPEFFKVAKLDKNLPLDELARKLAELFQVQSKEKDERELKEFISKNQLARVKNLELRFLSEVRAYFAGENSTLLSIKAIEEESEINPLAARIFGKSEEVRSNLEKFITCIEDFEARENFLTLQIQEIKKINLYEYALKLNNYKDIRALEKLISASKKEEFHEEKKDFEKEFEKEEKEAENLAEDILKTLIFASAALFTSAASEVFFDEESNIDEILDEVSSSFSDFLDSLKL